MSAQQATAASHSRLLDLVLMPGFSTAAKVSDISGRGVGMDVVKSNIENIGGQVALASSLGQGTTVSLRLPLTVAIIEGLLATSGELICAVPLASPVFSRRCKRVGGVCAQRGRTGHRNDVDRRPSECRADSG